MAKKVSRTEDMTFSGFKSVTKSQLIWRQLKRHQLGVIGGIILILLYGSAFFAEFIGPYSSDLQVRAKAFHPPTRLHFFDEDHDFSLQPFVYNYQLVDRVFKVYRPDPTVKYPLRFCGYLVPECGRFAMPKNIGQTIMTITTKPANPSPAHLPL